jgi:hypothetical protein
VRLPVRTALADIETICAYFAAKPGGATPAEVANEKALDRRKLSALKFWGLIEADDVKLRLSERGLLFTRDNGAHKARALRAVIASTAPYADIFARTVHRGEAILLSTDVAAHWHRHYRAHVDLRALNHQTVCFLRLAEGAALGRLIVGRKGQQTELSEGAARACMEDATLGALQFDADRDETSVGTVQGRDLGGYKPSAIRHDRRIFITQRRNSGIAEQVKELVAFGRFEPVIAQHHDATAKLSPHHLMNEMRGCDTAVIQVCADAIWLDADREPRIGGDVAIEIGAAIALFGRNFVLLVEEGIELPSTLHEPCACRYGGDELNMPAAMKLLRAFQEFMITRAESPIGLAHGSDRVRLNL